MTGMGVVCLNGGREASVALKLVLRSRMKELLLAKRVEGGFIDIALREPGVIRGLLNIGALTLSSGGRTDISGVVMRQEWCTDCLNRMSR